MALLLLQVLYKCYQFATLHSCVTEIAEVPVEGALLFYIWEMQPLEGNASIYCTDQKMNEKDSPVTFSSVSFGWNFCFPRQPCVQPKPRVVQ